MQSRANNAVPRVGDKPQRQKQHRQKGQQKEANGGPTQAPKRRKRGQRKPQRTGAEVATTDDSTESPKVEEEENTKSDDVDVTSHNCLICCDPIKKFSLGVCNHRSLCSMCSLRRRELYKQPECCLCKTQLKKVLFISDPDVAFENVDLRTLCHDAKRNLYFDDPSYADEITKLFDFICAVCSVKSDSLTSLKRHLQQQHNLAFCDLCLQHKKVFLREQTLYSPAELESHKKGIGENEMEQHQLCEFCRTLFYDKDDLYNHLTRQHELCYICEKDGIRYQYYRNYKSLEEHFRNQHFLCEEPNCLAQKFVVFRTALDLKAHDVTMHLADRNLSKSEARAARTLDAAVLFGDPRPRRETEREDRTGHRKGRGQRRDEPFVFSPNPSSVTTTTSSRSALPSRTPNIHSGLPNSAPKHGGKKDKNPKVKKEAVKGNATLDEETENQNSDQKNNSDSVAKNLHSQVEMQIQQAVITKEERQIRNKILIEKIRTFLGPERFDEFKRLSAELRLGHITPAQYYKRFMASFGWLKASELFPELVDLLPDPVLRAALLTLHKSATPSDYPQHPPEIQPSSDPVRATSKSTGSGPLPWGDTLRGGVAPSPHSTEDFPSLPPPPPKAGPSLMLTSDDFVDDDDFIYSQTDSFPLEARDRFHPTQQHSGQNKKSKKKGKQKQVLLRFG